MIWPQVLLSRHQRGPEGWVDFRRVTWDSLDDLFADLEAQAEGLHLAERDAELADRSQGEYASVTLASRLHGSVGATLGLRVLGVGRLVGQVVRSGSDWLLLAAESSGQQWVIRFAAVDEVRGAPHRAVSEPARSVTSRLGIRSALREMAESGSGAVLWRTDGTQVRGLPVRTGADFVEVAVAESAPVHSVLVPFDALAAITG